MKLLDQSVKFQSTLTINSDLIVSAVSCQHQVPLHLKRISDLRQIESLIDDISNFEQNPEIFDSSLVLVNIKEAAIKLQSSISILEDTELTEHCELEHRIPLLPFLQFVICQLENSLVIEKRRRYSVLPRWDNNFLTSCSTLLCTSYFLLGHCLKSTFDISRLLSFFSIVGLSYSSNNKVNSNSILVRVGYWIFTSAKKVTADFCERDRHVRTLDEIHVSPANSYHGKYCCFTWSKYLCNFKQIKNFLIVSVERLLVILILLPQRKKFLP